MPTRSLLVADDIECQTDAGKRRSEAIRDAASSLAIRLKTCIDLLYVEDTKAYSHELNSARFRAWHIQHLERLKVLGKKLKVPVYRKLKSGIPAEQILKAIHSRPYPELVIMGTQGRRGLKRVLIGSVAEEVIRCSRRPVMVIGPVSREKNQDFGQKQPGILVPTDLGRNSRVAEKYALSLARRIGARVTLFHCIGETYVEIIYGGSMVSGCVQINFDRVLAGIREEAVQALKKKAAFFREHGIPCEYKMEDHPLPSSRAVREECKRGYMFVVMGTRGRNVLLQAFLGSTAWETILNAPVPVITVNAGR